MSAADISRKEKYSRCVALEEDYVHRVYEQIGKDLAQAKDPLEATVKKFLDELEPGSLVADIGCGDGRHLRNKNGLFSLGADSSCLQASLARQRCQEALLGDNLSLPFRGNAFDAVLSVGVIHHFTTKERRIKALKELSRILKIGGRVLIAVQRHNTQISQDVLIPWFDVPKDKRMKDKHWFDQDSGEYELEDDRDEDGEDDDDDEDSISLPSSDEEDTPWTNYAKFFPPQTYYAKHGWNSERQSRSLDYDYQTSSNNVPNSKQLVQTNACYAFVRKALKRFSSVNTSDEDPYFTTELYRRADSAVPPSPASGQEQKFDLLNSSSFDPLELVQKTISDNFIELLNIDDEQDTSSGLRRTDCTYETLCRSDSKSDSSVKNKKNLIRSLSGMFKNVNSLWSSKGTKSCSDLKSQASSNESNFKGKNYRDRRLVRSKTTATCNPEFDYFNPLENIEEFDMSVSEANQIINDFLESSMPSVETVKSISKVQEEDEFTHLTPSDIVNGNTLPFFRDSRENMKSKNRKIRKLTEFSDPYSFRDCRTNRSNSKLEFDRCREIFYTDTNKTHDVENMLFSDNPKSNLFSFRQQPSKYDRAGNPSIETEYFEDKSCKVIFDEEDTKFKANEFQDKLSEKICPEFQDRTQKHEEWVVEEIKDIPPFNMYSSRETKSSSPENAKIRATELLVNDKKEDFREMLNSDIIQVEDGTTNWSNQAINIANQNKLSMKNDITSSSVPRCKKNVSSLTSSKLLETDNQEQVWGMKQEFCTNINYKCLLQNSPKRFRKLNQNYNYQMAGSKTLGPFYDEDSDDISIGEDSNLSSYYSMPELHALTEFYQEYSMYQNCIINNTSFELSKTHDICSPKKLDFYAGDHIPKLNIKTVNHLQNPNNDNILQMSSENYMYRDSLNTDFCIDNLKTDLCNSIQSAFTNTHSKEENKIDNKCNPINAIVQLCTKKFAIIPPVSLNKNLPLELNNSNKCRSLICINSNSSCGQSYNLNDSKQSGRLTRSHSIDTIHKSLNAAKCTEIHTLSNLSSSHTSLIFTRENSNKSNLNTLKQSQKNICNSEASYTFVDETEMNSPDQGCAIIPRRDADTKRNKRAFSETNEDFSTSSSISPNIQDNCSDFNSVPKVFDSYESNKTTNKNRERSSVPYNHILSDSEFSSESLNVIMKDSSQKVYDVGAQDVRKHQSFLKSKKVVDREVYDPAAIKDSHSSTLLSKLKYGDTISSSESVSENTPEFEIAYGFPKTFSLVNSNHPETSVKKLCVSDSDSWKSFKENNTQEYSAGKKMMHFSPENISRNEPISSPLHQVELVCGDNETKNGAKTNKKLPVKERFNSVSPSHFNSILSASVDSMPSYSSDSKRSDLSQTVQITEHKKISDSNVLYDEKVNHAYGRIHEDGAVVVGHRYHHLFEDEELDDLIENNISDLHVLNSFHEESYWCIIAEKVRVWTI